MSTSLTASAIEAGIASSGMASQPVIMVSVIGSGSLVYRGRDIGLRNRKACAMLAYLALSKTGEEDRERLVGLLWSEFSERNARATLRQAVHEVREALMSAGSTALISTRTTVGLQPGSFRVDLDDLLTAVAAREAPERLLGQSRLPERLLAGQEDLDPAFRVWLLAQRQTFHDQLTRGLEDGYRDTSLPRWRRRRLAEATLLLDPTHEEACRIVMRTAAEDGEISAALRAYDELYRILGDEYDMEPSTATIELVAQVKQGMFDGGAKNEESPSPLLYAEEMKQALVSRHRANQAPPVWPIPPKPSLVVEPFALSGVDADRVHLVEGFRIELIGCLSRFREWYVTRTDGAGTEDHGGAPVSARYAVTTMAYQAGTTINTVMVLQERPSGLVIWGERFELSLDRWFEAQQQIVRRIAATLNVQLSTERLMRLSSVPDVSLEAYDIWLRGQSVMRRFNAADWNRAVEMFAQGIERAPNFSPLYSSLVQANNGVHFVQPGMLRHPEELKRTLALAQKAVTLDPRDSRAELCLGWTLTMSGRHPVAELHMELACALNTNDPWTLASAAMFYAFRGNVARARDLAMQAMDMALLPTPSHWIYEASIRYLRGDNEGTIVAADHAQDALLTVPAWRAAAFAGLGRPEGAAREMARFYAGVRANWMSPDQPTDEMIGRWFMHLYPISQAETWFRLRDGVAAAGLSVAGLPFHG